MPEISQRPWIRSLFPTNNINKNHESDEALRIIRHSRQREIISRHIGIRENQKSPIDLPEWKLARLV
jgi:hypothetical protein